MSTTPRTDAECIQIYSDDVTGCSDARDYVDASFARELETELAAAQQEAAHYMSVAQKATDELARLRAENLTAHQMACAAGLERDQLRAEVERLTKQIKDDSRSYGCELRDPNGTIWEQAAKDHARAERAEAERDALAKDKARLDWLSVSDAWFDYPATGAFTPDTIRAAIDAAMKGTT